MAVHLWENTKTKGSSPSEGLWLSSCKSFVKCCHVQWPDSWLKPQPCTKTHVELLIIPGSGPSRRSQRYHRQLEKQTAAETQCRAKSVELPSVERSGWRNPSQSYEHIFIRPLHISAIYRRNTHLWCHCFVAGHPTRGLTTSCVNAKYARHYQEIKRDCSKLMLLDSLWYLLTYLTTRYL